MHFGFALELSDIDLWNIDLLDTHLDLLGTDIRSIFFVSIVSSRRLQDMSSRHLQDISSTRHVFKMSSGHDFKMSSRRLRRYKFAKLRICWIRLQDMSWRRFQDVFKTRKCLLGSKGFRISELENRVKKSP